MSVARNLSLLQSRLLAFGLLIFVGFALGSCSPQSKIVKNGTPDEKYELAKSYYAKKNYARALPLFQDLLGIYRDSKRSEEIYYYISYSFYGMGEYEAAGRHFRNFTETFFNSTKTEECFYMYCLCQYYATDPSYLDQSMTKSAIENFQLFLNLFPGSTYQEKVNENIDKLRRKLHLKAYNNAMLYYKMEDYKAASISLRNCIETYPDIEEKEEIEFHILKSLYLYAGLSVEAKKLERYQEVLSEFKEYAFSNNRDAEHYKQALEIKEKSEIQINKLKNNLLP
jgi:outer membrane protein assembly factor BamD